MSKEEEKRLTARLKKGDKDAFRQLFESLFPVFLSFARKLLRDRTIAEDLVQNVFMRIWLNHETIDDSKDIRNYILVAVRNEVNGHLRRIHKKSISLNSLIPISNTAASCSLRIFKTVSGKPTSLL